VASVIAIIGAGLIGRSWSIVFARAGWTVVLWDQDGMARDNALGAIRPSLQDLEAHGLIGPAHEVLARINVAERLDDALGAAELVVECAPEDLAVKRALFAELDATAPAGAILASSTSGFPASTFCDGLPGRHRCLIAHPVNPPHLLPLVELVPAPWTDPAVLERTESIMRAVGQTPIRVMREIDGFVLNRLQGALLNEALRLVGAGIASAEDVDLAVSHGLGLRWSFMGPLETIDLNAPGGIADYARRYAPMYTAMAHCENETEPWSEATVEAVTRARRARLPLSGLADRQAWRDHRLLTLASRILDDG
jgi:3-hydroxyacyl-CoA dehydrogenase